MKFRNRMFEWLGDGYGFYLLFMKNHGTPPKSKDITGVLMLYSMLLTLDLLLLSNITLEIFSPIDDYENFRNFGWVFFFVYFGVPYLAPIVGLIAAVKKSDSMMRA